MEGDLNFLKISFCTRQPRELVFSMQPKYIKYGKETTLIILKNGRLHKIVLNGRLPQLFEYGS
jgi:hypothetical protein